jgi:hypothetical protein
LLQLQTISQVNQRASTAGLDAYSEDGGSLSDLTGKPDIVPVFLCFKKLYSRFGILKNAFINLILNEYRFSIISYFKWLNINYLIA